MVRVKLSLCQRIRATATARACESWARCRKMESSTGDMKNKILGQGNTFSGRCSKTLSILRPEPIFQKEWSADSFRTRMQIVSKRSTERIYRHQRESPSGYATRKRLSISVTLTSSPFRLAEWAILLCSLPSWRRSQSDAYRSMPRKYWALELEEVNS